MITHCHKIHNNRVLVLLTSLYDSDMKYMYEHLSQMTLCHFTTATFSTVSETNTNIVKFRNEESSDLYTFQNVAL